MSSRFPAGVLQCLVAAGWTPARSVPLPNDLPTDFTIFSAAEKVLREFGGLHIGSVGPGQECATSDLSLSPASATGLSAHTGLATSTGSSLYPLGEFHHGHAFLLIDEDGAIYTYFDELEPYAASFDQALGQLVLGLRPRPNAAAPP
jgi:hypothetical protein